jgi:hypothetical protein
MVQLGAPTNQPMNIFVPFTQVQPWTMAAMLWYLPHTTFVDVSADGWDYVKYFERRWAERKTFINVEHDVLPAPGVLDSMAVCPHDWCVEDYQGPPPAPPSVANCFGVVKFSTKFIETVPNIWRDYRDRHEAFINSLVVPKDAKVGQGWRFLDVYLFEYMKEVPDHGFAPHHHWPLATNARAGDAFYAPIRVTDPDGGWMRDHQLSKKTMVLSLHTL